MVIRVFAALGLLLFSGVAVAQDYDALSRARDLLLSGAHDEAIAILAPAAEAGNARARNLMGAAHEHGLGVPQDGEAALRFYEAAAGQGYPPAIFNLGIVFARGGPGIAPDRARAIEMFDRAIGLDYAAAFGSYAAFLLETARSEEDLIRAETLLLRGAERGDPTSIEILAFLRRTGQVGPKDPAEARRLYEVAALMGSTGAQKAVASMFAAGEGGAADHRQAFEYYTYAINAGHADALHGRGRVIMAWSEEFENGAVTGLAECLAGADLAGRNEWTDLCSQNAADYPPELYEAALAMVPSVVEEFTALRQ